MSGDAITGYVEYGPQRFKAGQVHIDRPPTEVVTARYPELDSPVAPKEWPEDGCRSSHLFDQLERCDWNNVVDRDLDDVGTSRNGCAHRLE